MSFQILILIIPVNALSFQADNPGQSLHLTTLRLNTPLAVGVSFQFLDEGASLVCYRQEVIQLDACCFTVSSVMKWQYREQK